MDENDHISCICLSKFLACAALFPVIAGMLLYVAYLLFPKSKQLKRVFYCLILSAAVNCGIEYLHVCGLR